MIIDLFGGTGFIGNCYKKMFPTTSIHEKDDNIPHFKDVLYMISTTHNYNIFNDIQKDVNTNLVKFLSVLKHCKDKDIVFNFISSWFVYGKTELPAKENAICHPKGFYSITKKCAEDLLISYCETFDIKYRILRLCNVYGNGDKGVSAQKNALQYLINKIKLNENIKLYYGGQFLRDFLHVEDVCRAIHLCVHISHHNQIINIGSGRPQNFREIIDYAITKIDSNSKIIPIDAPQFHKSIQVKDMYLDCSKLNMLGFKQQISIQQGIDELLIR